CWPRGERRAPASLGGVPSGCAGGAADRARNHEVGLGTQGRCHLPLAPAAVWGSPAGGSVGVCRLDIARREASVITLDEQRRRQTVAGLGPGSTIGCGAADTVARHFAIIAGSPGSVNARSASRNLAAAEASNGANAISGRVSPRIVSLRRSGSRSRVSGGARSTISATGASATA